METSAVYCEKREGTHFYIPSQGHSVTSHPSKNRIKRYLHKKIVPFFAGILADIIWLIAD